MGFLLYFISLIPIMVAVNGIMGNLTVFTIAWYYETINITGQVPYISDCGNYVPASCVFSLICNLGCILALIFETVVYDKLCSKTPCDKASFFIGILSSLGLSITGNFQSSAVPVVHYIGAFLAFIFGFVYLAVNMWSKKGRYSRLGGLIGLVIYGLLLIILCILKWGFHLDSPAAICEWLAAFIFFCLYALFYPEFLECVSQGAYTSPEQPEAAEMS